LHTITAPLLVQVVFKMVILSVVDVIHNDTGSAELNTSKVFAWNRKVSIVPAVIHSTKVRLVNLFFYNIP